MEERTKGSCTSIRKIQEEKAVIERVTRIAGGVTQQNHMQFGLMVQNEDSVAQAHRDMRFVTILNRVEWTQKMIDMKMSMWEKMGDGAAKEKIYDPSKTCFINQRIFRLNFRMLDWRRECLIRSF